MNKDSKNMVDLSDDELLEMAGGYNLSLNDLVTGLPPEAIAVVLYGVLPSHPGIFLPKYGIKPFPIVMYGIKPLYGIKPDLG